MTRRERELRVIVRRHGVVAAEVAKSTDMTRRERELRLIVRRHGVVAAEVAKSTNINLAWKIEVSTVIPPAEF